MEEKTKKERECLTKTGGARAAKVLCKETLDAVGCIFMIEIVTRRRNVLKLDAVERK